MKSEISTQICTGQVAARDQPDQVELILSLACVEMLHELLGVSPPTEIAVNMI